MSTNPKLDYSSNKDQKVVKKRNRPSLVCFPCRKRKIRCDKNKPCYTCVKQDIVSQCIYDERLIDRRERNTVTKTTKNKNKIRYTNPETSLSKELKEKLIKTTDDVCVLIRKSELEHLQNALKKYETSQNSPMSEDIKKVTSRFEPHDDNNIVYNVMTESYITLFRGFHDKLRPGHMPLKGVLTNDSLQITNASSVTKTIDISKLPKNDSLNGINPFATSCDLINFHSMVNKNVTEFQSINYYPLSWNCIVKNSSALRALRKFAEAQTDSVKTKVGITYDPLKKLMVPKDESVKQALLLDNALHKNFEEKDEQEDELLKKKKVNLTTFALSLSILSQPKERETNLIEQIKSVMPNKIVVWLLIRRYLNLLYPLFPFLIEEQFLGQIERIIGKESYLEEKPMTNIETQIDFAYISILFVILRLSYLSLFHNRGFYNEKILIGNDLTKEEKEKKYLLMNPIHIYTVEVAQTCLLHLEKRGKVSFPLLQASMYLRIYKIFGPEEGDGLDGGNSQLHLSQIISMAYMLGLNRDPDTNTRVTDEKVKTLYRKIWYYCLIMEFNQASLYGNPILIKPESYDTKCPNFTPEYANLINQEIDKASYAIYEFGSALINGPVSVILKMYEKVDAFVRVSELTTHLNQMEQGVVELLGNIGDYIFKLEAEDRAYTSTKILKLGVVLRMNTFLITNYCYLFNYYELKNPNLSYFYLKKVFALTIKDILPYIFPMITKSRELFGEGSDVYINPGLMLILSRICDMSLIAMLRANFSLYQMSNDRNHQTKLKDTDYKKVFDTLNKFILLTEKCCRICLTATSVLSSRYYFAWGIIKTQNFYLKLVTNPDFYKHSAAKDLHFHSPHRAQMHEVIDIMTNGLELLEKLVDQYCTEVDLPSIFKRGENQSQPKCSLSRIVNKTHSTNTDVAHLDLSSLDNNQSEIGNNGLYYTEFEDLKFDNSAEIDSIWLQMLNSRNDNNDNSQGIQNNFQDHQQFDSMMGYSLPDQFYDTINPETTNRNDFQNNFNLFDDLRFE